METNRNQMTDGPLVKHGLKLDQITGSENDDATEGHRFKGALSDAGEDESTEGHGRAR